MFDKWKETETSKRPDIVITILTLSSFVAGAIAPFSIPLSVMLYLPIAMYPFFRKINHLTPVHIGYCTMSTYIFGFLDIYSLLYPSIFSLYVWLLTIRYYSEFQLNNCYHHDLLNWSGFTIYHSKEYCIANTFLLLQHLITRYYFQFDYKIYHFMVIPSFIISCLALVLRVLSFYTAKHNFTHRVSYTKKKNHELVTDGVYKYLRHPSYTGFFYYSVFSMIMIGNFISALLFFIALSKFFRDRIEDEEEQLFMFFPGKYRKYYEKTYTFIPFLIKYQ